MPKISAGILLYRFKNNTTELLIVHPGGPFWAKKDDGAWSIPKGELDGAENALDAAIREFREETGKEISGNFIPLTPAKQSSGKIIIAFALEHDLDTTTINSNTFSMEWPPKSGKLQEFPEIDKARWADIETCKLKLNMSQVVIAEELIKILKLRRNVESNAK